MAEMPPAERKPKQEESQYQHDYQALIGGERKAGTYAGKDFFGSCHLI